MKLLHSSVRLLAAATVLTLASAPARAEESFAKVAAEVNQKLVKLFGSGGIRGLPSYGTGVVVSSDGYILTVASHILDTVDLRVHLADGRRYHAKVVVTEPQLDVALVKIDKVEGLPYFDISAAARKPLVGVGTGVLAFSNQFQIATRDEPMSVQRGVVAAYCKLHGRRGIFDASFQGEVYVMDAITNNPGAGGGVITTRKGELLGLIGKELRNTLTDTWINYAVPIQAKVEGKRDDQTVTVSLAEFVENAKEGRYTRLLDKSKNDGPGGYHGLVLVIDEVELTPPYIEEVIPGSPAAKAGFKADDLIVYIEGEQIRSIKNFHEIVDRAPPGTVYKVEVRRGDKLTTLELKLEEPLGRTPPPKKPSP
jgi:S1-C subfamily serine protease